MKLHNITLTTIFFLLISAAYAKKETIISGDYKSKTKDEVLKLVPVSVGDTINIKLMAKHKKKGINLTVKQHPGNIEVFHFENWNSGQQKLVASSNAIYEIISGGARIDYNIEIIKDTQKPSGPGLGEIVYVRMPDTIHASGYINKNVGENYTLYPYKTKAVVGTTEQSEMICNRDFFTGVDVVKLSIPGDSKDEYRVQKLIGYSINVTCQETQTYGTMLKVLEEGVKMATDKVTGSAMNKIGKFDHAKKNKVLEYSEKTLGVVDATEQTLSIGDDILKSFGSSDGDNSLNKTAFIIDEGGFTSLALNQGLNAVSVPDGMSSLTSVVEKIPSASEMIADGITSIIPSQRGKVQLLVREVELVTSKMYKFPNKPFQIQSALSYGTNSGYFDVPGFPQQCENGLQIHCWDIDAGPDRKFTLEPSNNFPGYYNIVSVLPGSFKIAIDNQNGNTEMQKNKTNIRLWKKNDIPCMAFYFDHQGQGKFKIRNYDGFEINADNRSSKNGSNIHIWEPHPRTDDGNWTQWYLIDPTTRQAFIPTDFEEKLVRRVRTTMQAQGSIINKEVILANENTPINTDGNAYKELSIYIDRVGDSSKAKLMVEAQYRVTEFTDVIKYSKSTNQVTCNDYWTAYKIKYDYAIMFKDQMKDYFDEITEAQYRSTARPHFEKINNSDTKQKERLRKYNILKPDEK